jgi:hypothetical protein
MYSRAIPLLLLPRSRLLITEFPFLVVLHHAPLFPLLVQTA